VVQELRMWTQFSKMHILQGRTLAGLPAILRRLLSDVHPGFELACMRAHVHLKSMQRIHV